MLASPRNFKFINHSGTGEGKPIFTPRLLEWFGLHNGRRQTAKSYPMEIARNPN